jgi:hypothetical protein
MKNVIYHVKKKWIQAPDNNTVLINTNDPIRAVENPSLDGPGPDPPSYVQLLIAEDEDNPEAEDPEEIADSIAATNLLQPEDQAMQAGNSTDIEPSSGVLDAPEPAAQGHRYYEDSHEGFLRAWKKVVYAETQAVFQRAWNLLEKEFARQIRKCYALIIKLFTALLLLLYY